MDEFRVRQIAEEEATKAAPGCLTGLIVPAVIALIFLWLIAHSIHKRVVVLEEKAGIQREENQD